MAGINNSNEPSTAPQADRWYNLTLGSSFKDHNPSKFCTFRCMPTSLYSLFTFLDMVSVAVDEFKPASIDKNQRGALHKSKDNKVTVEFQNIQPGKPKMIFEGTSEDYKDNDAVLFFDGESFRLERLQRAVKRLRHNRMLSESTGAVAASAGPSDASSPPVGKVTKHQPLNKDTFHAAPVEVEQLRLETSKAQALLQIEVLPSVEHDEDNNAAADEGTIDVKEIDFDINIPHQTDTDDEIADVDVSDDEADKGPNAAEALRAQHIDMFA
ncbi:hypothetical protein DH2020_037508 [Rehmannia glutinosa]|uniref:Transcription elongation factor Eaf N-terminal domain-containing protein n=1 Tax=Rehmannia glutinosa TaxID=99300 RepID=A0ABR0V163_REHGL